MAQKIAPAARLCSLALVGLGCAFAAACGGQAVALTSGSGAGAGGAAASSSGSAAENAGASAVPVGKVWASPGCNRAIPAGQTLGQYVEYSTHVTGRTLDPTFSVAAHDRGYYVWLPEDYDNTKPSSWKT